VITSIYCSIRKNGKITPSEVVEVVDKSKAKDTKKVEKEQEYFEEEELMPQREL